MLNQPTIEKLHTLRLAVMAEAWSTQAKNPQITTLAFDERFGLIVDAEYLARDNRRLDRLLKDAQLRFLRGEIDTGTTLVARGAGGIVSRPDANSNGKSEGKSDLIRPRGSPRSWAAWVLSGDWR